MHLPHTAQPHARRHIRDERGAQQAHRHILERCDVKVARHRQPVDETRVRAQRIDFVRDVERTRRPEQRGVQQAWHVACHLIEDQVARVGAGDAALGTPHGARAVSFEDDQVGIAHVDERPNGRCEQERPTEPRLAAQCTHDECTRRVYRLAGEDGQ